MDPLTHAALGAVAGTVVSRTPSRHGLAVGALGALAPDLDVLVRSGTDPLLAIEVHRQFTHALAVAPLGAVIVALLYRTLFARARPAAPLFVAALAGWVSACLLDACTSYGTRLGWPLSDASVAWNIVAVVDPIATLIVLVTSILLWRGLSRRTALVGATLMAGYLGLGALQHERAETRIDALIAQRGHAADQRVVKPTLGNLTLWRSVYRAQGQWWIDAVHVGPLGGERVYEGRAVGAVDVDALATAAPQAAAARRFADLSQDYVARHPDDPAVIGDIRYAMQPDGTTPLWGIRLTPAHAGAGVKFETFRQRAPGDGQRFLDMVLGRPIEP